MNSLSSEQKTILLSLHRVLSQNQNDGKGQCLLLDAPPGTGKTYLIAALSLTLCELGLYTAYSNNLASAMSEICTIDAMTNCKFLMDFFDVNYMKAKFLWNSRKHPSIGDQVFCLLEKIKKATFNKEIHQILMLDEYTIVSPWQIFMYFLLSKVHGVVVMYSGDRNQLSSIDKTIYHQENNYRMAKCCSDEEFRLVRLMRQDGDEIFSENIRKITQSMEDPNFFSDCNLAHKYLIFTLFPEKFFTVTDYTALFMAQHHRSITERIVKYTNSKQADFDSNSNRVFKSYYHDSLIGLTITSKFPMYLLMVLNNHYIYTDQLGSKHIVVLRKFGLNLKSELIYVIVQYVENANITLKLTRQSLNDTFMVPEHMSWLREVATIKTAKDSLKQFPLKFFAYTYYAAQGLTLSNEKIELDIDTNLQSIYVGLTRVKKSEQINRLYTEDLINILVTFYFNDDYYYKMSSKSVTDSFVKDIIVATLNNLYCAEDNLPKILVPALENKLFLNSKSIVNFNSSRTANIRILRQNLHFKDASDTQLMKVVKLLKNNENLLTETCKEVFVERVNNEIGVNSI